MFTNLWHKLLLFITCKITLWKLTNEERRANDKPVHDANVFHFDLLTLKIHSNIHLNIFKNSLLPQRKIVLKLREKKIADIGHQTSKKSRPGPGRWSVNHHTIYWIPIKPVIVTASRYKYKPRIINIAKSSCAIIVSLFFQSITFYPSFARSFTSNQKARFC